MKEYELTYQKNIRDLGGLIGYQGMKVKSGRIFRGGFLDKVTPEDEPIVLSFNLTDIVDFRGEDEVHNRPDYFIPGVSYHNFPVIEEKVDKKHSHEADGNLLWFVENMKTGREHMLEIYKETVSSPKGIEAYSNFFKVLMKDDKRVTYFHCSQGKDRAGLAAFLIEIALGVDLEVAKEDYLRSNKAMGKRVDRLIEQVKNKSFFDERYRQSLYEVFSAHIDYLEEAIKAMESQGKTIIGYIKNVLGVDIDKFRELYLE